MSVYAHFEPPWPRPWYQPAQWSVEPRIVREGDYDTLPHTNGNMPAFAPAPGDRRWTTDHAVNRPRGVPAPGWAPHAWLWVPGREMYESDDLWSAFVTGEWELVAATRWAMREARKLELKRNLLRDAWELDPDLDWTVFLDRLVAHEVDELEALHVEMRPMLVVA